jgi:hypothetical protein
MALLLLMTSCGLCGEKVLREVTSPEKTRRALLYERNCGATTNYVQHVNIAGAQVGLAPDSYGVVKTNEVFVADGSSQIELIWRSESELVVKCSSCSSPAKQDTEIENIVVHYEIEARSTP